LLFKLLAAQQRAHSSTPHSHVPPRPPRPRPHRQHRWRGSSQRGGHQRRKSLQDALAPAMIHKQESPRRDRSAMSTEVRAAKGRLPFHTAAVGVHKLLGQRTWTCRLRPTKDVLATCWPRLSKCGLASVNQRAPATCTWSSFLGLAKAGDGCKRPGAFFF
jgi:hypothetical protein